MGASQHGQLPADLVQGQRRFQAWRGQRKPGGRIPQPLWAMAVRLAKAHGVSRTAAVLGLDYYSLKKRADASAAAPPPSSAAAFVELAPPVMSLAKHCRLELDNGAGATLRVQLVGYDTADIEALARSFWDAL